MVCLNFGQKNTEKLTQNELKRFVLNLEHRLHIDRQHVSLNWLPVGKWVEQIIIYHAFKMKKIFPPEYMSDSTW